MLFQKYYLGMRNPIYGYGGFWMGTNIRTKRDATTLETLRRHARGRAFLAVGLLGTVLQAIPVIQGRDFWNDEQFTLYAITSRMGNFWSKVSADTNPPLYYAYLRLFDPFGHDVSGHYFRFATLLIWPVLVIAVYFFVDKRPQLRVAALVGLALMATSPVTVYLFSELRMYGLSLALCYFLCVLTLDLAFNQDRTPGQFVVFGILSGLLLLTHYGNVFILLGTWLSLALFSDDARAAKLRGFAICGASAIAILLPFSGIIAHDLMTTSMSYQIPITELLRFALMSLGGTAICLVFIRRSNVHREGILLVTSVAIALAFLGLLSFQRGQLLGNVGMTATIVVPALSLLIGYIVEAVGSKQILAVFTLGVSLNIAFAVLVQAQPAKFLGENRVSLMSDLRTVLKTDNSPGSVDKPLFVVEWRSTEFNLGETLKTEFPLQRYAFIPRERTLDETSEALRRNLSEAPQCSLVFSRSAAGLKRYLSARTDWIFSDLTNHSFEVCPPK
jgi:hypothetical protein